MPNKNRILAVFRQRLERLPVGRHPALYFNPWVEGYKDFVFGGRAGPAVQCTSLFHELGHAAQFGADKFRTRASEAGFLFKSRRRFIYDRYCEDPRTGQATHRELDTFAHQLHLMRVAGYKVEDGEFMRYSARLMTYMSDWYNIPGDDEAGRAKYCHDFLAERYATLKASEVLAKLETWLDLTAKRLVRKKLAYPAHWQDASVRERYHADGHVWACQRPA